MASRTYVRGGKVYTYKNPNYDPVKAHEYYVKHRKLKGRRKKAAVEEPKSTKTTTKLELTDGSAELTDGTVKITDGTSKSNQSDYLKNLGKAVTKPIPSEVKNPAKTSTAGLNEAGKAKAKALKSQLNSERDQAITKHKEAMNTLIADLKNKVKNCKTDAEIESLAQEIEKARFEMKTNVKKIRDDYTNKYAEGLNQIKLTGDYQNLRSSAGMTEEAKAQMTAAKEKCKEERKKEVDAYKEKHKQHQQEIRARAKEIRENRKEALKKISDGAKDRIADIRERLKNMSKEARKLAKDKLTKEIEDIRATSKADKEKVKASYDSDYQACQKELKDANAKYKEDYKKFSADVKEKYNKKYNDELRKIKAKASSHTSMV